MITVQRWSPHEQANAVATDVGPAPTAQGLRMLSVILVTVSVIIFATWTWLANFHAHDRYQIDATSGVHMAIAWNANHGILFPPVRRARVLRRHQIHACADPRRCPGR